MLAEAAASFIIVADSRKDSKVLGTNWKQGVPIEVAPFAWAKVFQSASPASRLRGSTSPMLTDHINHVRLIRPAEDGVREARVEDGQDEGWPGRDRQRVRPAVHSFP